MGEEIMAEGRYVRLIRRDGWEFVSRRNTTGIVIVVALTEAGELLLVEQHRPPLGCRVIELPAGLAGDIAGEEDEALETAARRELLEETGYAAERLVPLTAGPLSAGLTTEVVTIFGAAGARRVAAGGGDASEDIAVSAVPLGEVPAWLEARRRGGVMVDPKVYAALWFAGQLAG